MTAFKAWWAKSRWALWVVIGFITSIVLTVLWSLFFSGRPKIVTAGVETSPVVRAIQARVDRAEEDGLRARVEATAVAGERKKRLDEVMLLTDGVERRKRLAAMLREGA